LIGQSAEFREGSVPIYEYVCSKCGESFEKLVRSTSSEVEVRCPRCDADKVARKISVFGFSGGSSSSLSFDGGSSCGPTSGG
jgi:putative FmdB family regulatory protein